MPNGAIRKIAKASSAVDKWRELQKSVNTRRGSLTWMDCPSQELVEVAASVTEDGAALLLSKTSDGGALVLRVIVDRESVPFYAPDMAALNALLLEVGEMFRKP